MHKPIVNKKEYKSSNRNLNSNFQLFKAHDEI